MELAAEHLTVRFAATPALVDVSLRLAPGRQVAICGPAGSGKTTLLKALAGLIPPSQGRVLWNGADVQRLSTAERRTSQARLGMIFQSDALLDSLTVLDNVLLPLRKRGLAEAEAHEVARRSLAAVGLADATSKRPEELSGGMKKRAGVARAIVARPEVLFADDPFAGLDPSTERSIAKLLLEVSAGHTLVVAAPDPPAALPDLPVAWLRNGELAAQR